MNSIFFIVLSLTFSFAFASSDMQNDKDMCTSDKDLNQIDELKAIKDKITEPTPQKNKIKCSKHASGAWFYKVATKYPSTKDIGITASGKLPTLKEDPARYYSQAGHYQDGPLDRPSVYLGGEVGGRELDAGLTWDREYNEDGSPKDSFAFRPFWRNQDKPKGPTTWHNPQKVHSTNNNKEQKSCQEEHLKELPKECSQKNIYFKPGDDLEMSLKQLHSNLPVIQIRMVIKDKKDPTKCFAVCFPHHGKKTIGSTWKRVNSIDQFKTVKCGNKECREGNERGNVLDTKASATNAKWDSVRILQTDSTSKPLTPDENAEIVLGKEFCNGTRKEKHKYFQDTKIDKQGGQKLSIIPVPESDPL